VSVWEIWGALLHGGRLVVVPRAVAQSTPDFYQLVRDQRVTVLNQTPSAFYVFIEQDQLTPAPLALRTVVFAGEALALDKLRPWFERHSDTAPELVNMYGITETTVHVSYR
ncbi:AMP-binding protein, partial [Janthinobacterium sp. GMG1]